METIFVAFGFSEPNRLLVREIEQLCFSQGVRLISGETMGGASLGPSIRQRIRECDGLIAIATRDQPLDGTGKWAASQWVRDEFGQAVGASMPTIALVEEGVEWEGMFPDHQRIDFDRDRSAVALLRLANTIAYWRQIDGRRLKLRLDLGSVAASQIAQIRYRCLYRGNEDPTWRSSTVIQEPGGAFVFIKNVKSEDHAIEVEASTYPPVKTLRSVATPQVVPIALMEA